MSATAKKFTQGHAPCKHAIRLAIRVRQQWDTLFRGGMVLETPVLKYIAPADVRRRFCVATIRRDARKGTVIITAAGT